ncbi:LPD38 domain-containing protein [Delftia sp. ASV31]|uniref:LPD38 domain-containing protein n=1 Tax=Delftia sp. ASV31 TaxID=2795113 RepID=UPI0022B85FB8|nr:LPD38 domain-containing protein [Delftia sp. ASV31]
MDGPGNLQGRPQLQGPQAGGGARAKDSTAAPFRWVATAANATTGGNEWRPGAFSPTPEAIEYLFGQITGGWAGRLRRLSAWRQRPGRGRSWPRTSSSWSAGSMAIRAA